MFQGLRTAIYRAENLSRTKEWYTAALSAEPYFDEPYYVGFDVGGFELGLLPEEPGESAGSTASGVAVYWGVADADEAHERLLEHGAVERGGVQDVGGGIRIASVLDPEGNILGIVENPNFSLGGA